MCSDAYNIMLNMQIREFTCSGCIDTLQKLIKAELCCHGHCSVLTSCHSSAENC